MGRQDNVDGRNPTPPRMYKIFVNTGINYQPQLVQNLFHQQYGSPPRKASQKVCGVQVGCLDRFWGPQVMFTGR